MDEPIHVIGGGLAGSEAAWQAAEAGARVVLHEMRPAVATPAHRTDGLAELVCSNSFRSDDAERNAVGLLHAEMRALSSLVMACADACQTPAGSALAVDRVGFSEAVTAAIGRHPRITIVRDEVPAPPESWMEVVIATGPLTSAALAEHLAGLTGRGHLAFFDAIAPVVEATSVDLSIAWKQSRWDKAGPGGDAAAYINCPLDRAQYETFVDALLEAEKAQFHDWENVPYFDGCLPIEVMAERGRDTLRHGPMKPIGLADPHRGGARPYAVAQLRQDDAAGRLWNMVGFQTKLKHGEQVRLFRTIPGLAKAVFARMGGLHRNTFVDGPAVLAPDLTLRVDPRLRLAGQITGVEGYVESAAIGLVAGRLAAARVGGRCASPPPPVTAIGALVTYVTGAARAECAGPFQPMNVTWGLLPSLPQPPRRRDERRAALGRRALEALGDWALASR